MAALHPWQTLEALRRELDRVFDETGTRALVPFDVRPSRVILLDDTTG